MCGAVLGVLKHPDPNPCDPPFARSKQGSWASRWQSNLQKDFYTPDFADRALWGHTSKTMSDYVKKCRRRFDRQFKEDAVALVRNGRAQAEVARDLGVSSGVLSTWVQQVEAGQALSAARALQGQTPEQRELRRLQQENDFLRQQRDILKKALGICPVEMPAPASR